jgi:hypothetical protein
MSEQLIMGAFCSDEKRREGASATRLCGRSTTDEAFEEWFWVYHTHHVFESQQPQSHPLYELAQKSIDPDKKEFEFYQATYDALVVLFPRFCRIIEKSHSETDREKRESREELEREPPSPPVAYRSKIYHETFSHTWRRLKALVEYLLARENCTQVFTDIVKLQTGICTRHLLRLWPEKWIPSYRSNRG